MVRKIGDIKGNKTCHQYNGSSLVDYVITDSKIFSDIKFLKVETLKPHLSDHCAITYLLKCNRKPKATTRNTIKIKMSPFRNLVWNENAESSIREVLQSTKYVQKFKYTVENNSTTYSTSEMVSDYSDALIEACREAGLKHSAYKNNKSNNKKDHDWFDAEC